MIFNLETIDRLSESAINTLKRFPMASFSAFLLTIILISLVELDYYQQESEVTLLAIKIAFVSSLGIVLFPALQLLYSHFLSTLVALGLIVGYYYILPLDIYASEYPLFFRHILLIFALLFMFIWAPFLFVKISNKNIWEWTQNLILALVASIFFSLILYGGLSLAFYAIERLFDVDISDRRYLQLGIAVFGIYGVNFFLSQIPKYILLLQVRTYTKVEVIFTKYILTSLAIGYFLIIFAYDIKIMVAMDFPKGVLAWITVIFSLVAVATYLFWTPLWDNEDNRFKKVIWIAILLQTLMLGLAIEMRIDEYGFTESRYFIALLGLWLFMMSLYFIFIKSASYKWLFVSLSLLLVGSQFGKYSAVEVSRKNQTARLYHIIEKAEPLSEKLDIKTKYEISDLLDYLVNNHGIKSLNGVIPKVVERYELLSEDNNSIETSFPAFATEELGFRFVNRGEYLNSGIKIDKEISFISSHRDGALVEVEGYRWLTDLHFNIWDKHTPKIMSGEYNISLMIKDNALYITEGNSSTKIDLNSFVNGLDFNSSLMESGLIVADNMEQSFQTKDQKVKLLVNNLIVKEDGNISSLSGKILFGKTDPSKN